MQKELPSLEVLQREELGSQDSFFTTEKGWIIQHFPWSTIRSTRSESDRPPRLNDCLYSSPLRLWVRCTESDCPASCRPSVSLPVDSTLNILFSCHTTSTDPYLLHNHFLRWPRIGGSDIKNPSSRSYTGRLAGQGRSPKCEHC